MSKRRSDMLKMIKKCRQKYRISVEQLMLICSFTLKLMYWGKSVYKALLGRKKFQLEDSAVLSRSWP